MIDWSYLARRLFESLGKVNVRNEVYDGKLSNEVNEITGRTK
ncbi:MAG: hypothetical protein ACTS4V_00275 [Candidatus Hodgkinia cicadicola]